jgi:hypothetical protein
VDITYVQHFPTAVDLFYTYTEELSTSCQKWEDSHSWARIVIVVIVIVIVVVIVIVIWGHVK